MKKCNSCQAVQNDENLICEKCGSPDLVPVEDVVDVKAEVVTGQAKGNPDYKKLFYLAGGVVAVLAVVILVLVLTLNPADRVMRSIKEGDFQSASQLFQEKVDYNSKNYQKLYEELTAYVDEKLAQFRSEEITYDELMADLNGVDMVGALGYEMVNAYEEANQLHYFRETYAAAEVALADKNFGEAMNLYAQVAGMDFENGENATAKYAEATTLFRDDVVAQANTHIAANEYDQAAMIIEQALVQLPEDLQLLQLQQSCTDGEYQYGIQQMIAEARAFGDGKDYPAALSCLDGYIKANPEEIQLQDARGVLLKEYEAYVLEESLRLAREEKYEHAANLAKACLSYFESAEVTRMLEIYKSHIPVLLGEMEMFQNNTKGGSMASKTDEVDAYQEDNYGNTYEHSFSADCGSVVYLLNFKYQTFSGTVAFPKGVESDNYRSFATLKILGDDKEIAKFSEFNSGSKPQFFELDVSAYEKITLKWECAGNNIWRDWGYFATIFDGQIVPIPVELPAE